MALNLSAREKTALELIASGTPRAVYSGFDPEMRCQFSARADLAAIRAAWERGCDFEMEADGFGEGAGTHDDWSAIRDSSETAVEAMLQKAVAFLHSLKGRAVYRIWCQVSGGVTGSRESWMKVGGKTYETEDKAKADAEASRLNVQFNGKFAKAEYRYTVKEAE